MIRKWWQARRICTCDDPRSAHMHYSHRQNRECALCEGCKRFQWRMLRWVY